MAQQKPIQFVLSTVSDNSRLDPALFRTIFVSQGMLTARKTESWETSNLCAQKIIFLPFKKVSELSGGLGRGVWLVPPPQGWVKS